MNDELKEFNQTGKPLGEWTEEDIKVKSIDYNPETKRATVVDKIEKQKVMYVYAPKSKFRCKSGEHTFHVIDKSRWLFACDKCPFVRKVFPTTYRLTEDGHLQHKVTGAFV